MQDVLRRHFNEACPVAPQRANRANHSWGTKAGSQQAYGVEILNPLAIGDVALSAWNVLEVMCVDQEDFDAAGLQDLVHRNPVHTGGLHCHGANTAALKPIRELL